MQVGYNVAILESASKRHQSVNIHPRGTLPDNPSNKLFILYYSTITLAPLKATYALFSW